MRWVVTWVFNTLALFTAAWLLPGIDYGDDWWTLLIAGVVFTLANSLLKPILAILSIPFILVTLGLFYFLINIGMLYLTAWIVPDLRIDSFWWAALAAIIISVVNGILHMIFGRPGGEPQRTVVVERTV